MTFDFRMTFNKKNLRSVSRAATQRLRILGKSWRVFHDRLLPGRCFRGFVLHVLEYCSAADTHLNPLNRVVSVVSLLTWSMFDCDIAHRRSVAVLCMLYKIRCNPMPPLYGALPGRYVSERVTLGALVAHRFTYAPPRCRTSQYRRTFIPLSVSLCNDLGDQLFYGVGLEGFKSRANAFLLASLLASFLPPTIFLFSSLIRWVGIAGLGLRTDRVLAVPTFFNNNNNNNILFLL